MGHAPVTMARVSDEVMMERMTWRPIETALANGKTTALLNAGAIEQQGIPPTDAVCAVQHYWLALAVMLSPRALTTTSESGNSH